MANLSACRSRLKKLEANFQEHIENQNSEFYQKEPQAVKEQIKLHAKTLAYIEYLGSTAEIDIANWNLSKIFGLTELETFFSIDLKKQAINQKFFQIKEEFNKSIPKTKPLDPKDILRIDHFKDFMQSSFVQDKNVMIAKHKRNIEHYEETIIRIHGNLDEALRSLTKEKRNLDLITLSDHTEQRAIESLKNILSLGLWGNPKCVNGTLWLSTNTDIVCHYHRPSAGIDLIVNFGKLAIRLNFVFQTDAIVVPYQKNIYVDTNSFGKIYHPHINNGKICWGTAYSQAHNLWNDRNLVEYLKLLYSLLTTYNPDNPYAAIESFSTHSKIFKKGMLDDDDRYPDEDYIVSTEDSEVIP